MTERRASRHSVDDILKRNAHVFKKTGNEGMLHKQQMPNQHPAKHELQQIRPEPDGPQYEKLLGQISSLRSLLRQSNARNVRLTREIVKLKTDAVEAAWYSGDAVDRFLIGLGLSKNKIKAMSLERKKLIISKLEKIAATSFHPQNGITPDEETLKKINGFLSENDPRFSFR